MTDRSSFVVGGVRLHSARSGDIAPRIARWCSTTDSPRSVVFLDALRIVTAGRDPELLEALNQADLAVVDCVPIAWAGTLMTGVPCERLSAPDLMHVLLTQDAYSHLRHFVYGGTQEALERLEFRYNRGGVIKPRRIVGTYSPPLDGLSPAEEEAFVQRIHALLPDIVWVCLETAHQEKWIHSMRSSLSVPVVAGAGAAVDFLSGQKRRAPIWMRRVGLEWLFRLVADPRRLWRRDLPGNVLLVRLAVAEVWRHHQVRRQQA